MKLSLILPHLIYKFKSEADLLKAIEEISLKFTKERDKIGDYLKDPRLVAAYTAFYLLTNIPKLEEVLKWMPLEWTSLLKECDFIDLGAGPGTFSLAWKNLGEIRGDFYQIEQSATMREQGLMLWKGFHQEKLFQSAKWDWKNERPKFLLFGHSANEMGNDQAIQYIEKINPEHVLFIEPGTKEFFPQMLKIRDHLLNRQYAVLYPCPHGGNCPMHQKDDWCHQFIQVEQDAEIERISQMARKDRKLLPLTVHAYSRTFKTTNPSERLVRVFPETKFSFEWEICHQNQLERYQIMKRDLSKSEVKELGSVLAGASLESELLKELDQYKRVKIIKIK
ncbi:MAG: small ribosomal subunit Rsm22 family protein [Bacteriovoracaceae bacterium]|nr:small ribosomal subunit Rsm22 family protein [Bacteriovoracaceae bacterium]